MASLFRNPDGKTLENVTFNVRYSLRSMPARLHEDLLTLCIWFYTFATVASENATPRRSFAAARHMPKPKTARVVSKRKIGAGTLAQTIQKPCGPLAGFLHFAKVDASSLKEAINAHQSIIVYNIIEL